MFVRLSRSTAAPLLVLGMAGASCENHEADTPPPAVAVHRAPNPEGARRMLGELSRVSKAVINTDAQDHEIWQLTQRAANSGVLLGASQSDIETALGKGSSCSDWVGPASREIEQVKCYDEGTLPAHTLGGTPILVLGYDRAGVCVFVRALHGQ